MPEENITPEIPTNPISNIPQSVLPVETKKSGPNKWLVGAVLLFSVLIALVGYLSYRISYPNPVGSDNKSSTNNTNTSDKSNLQTPVKIQLDNTYSKTITDGKPSTDGGCGTIPAGIVNYSDNPSDTGNMTIINTEIKGLPKQYFDELDNFLSGSQLQLGMRLKFADYFKPTCEQPETLFLDEIKDPKITYVGIDKVRIIRTFVGMDAPGQLLVEIYGKKGNDYFKLQSSPALMDLVNKRLWDECGDIYSSSFPDCVQNKAKIEPQVLLYSKDAAQELANLFRLKK